VQHSRYRPFLLCSRVDFDPEDEVIGHDPEDNFAEDTSAVRDHYIDVG
jgi:protein AATF/BFR2